MIDTILHHAFPRNTQLLFAFYFELPSNSPSQRPRRAESSKAAITNGHEAKKALPVRTGSSIRGLMRGSSTNSTPTYTPYRDTPPPPPPNKPDRERHGRTPQFRKLSDWEDQITRTGARSVRVTDINREFRLSDRWGLHVASRLQLMLCGYFNVSLEWPWFSVT